MGIDTVKVLFTYTIVSIVIVGGFVFLYSTRHDADIQDLRILIGGFMGSCITWVVGAETATRTARQIERSTNQAQANALATAAQATEPMPSTP